MQYYFHKELNSSNLFESTLPQVRPVKAEARAAKVHGAAIQDLAKLLQRSVQEVAPLYYDVLVQMQGRAVIGDYLPIFVAKRVRHLLEH
jgi:hypothetical protein